MADKQDADKLQGRAISSGAPSDDDILKWDAGGSQWQPEAEAGGAGNPDALDVRTSEVTVQNSAAETTVYQESILGGTLGSNNVLRLEIPFKYRQRNGLEKHLTVRLKYGATTVATALEFRGGDRTYYGVLRFSLKGDGETDSQFGLISGFGSVADVPWANADHHRLSLGDDGAAAEDSTGALNLTITVQHQEAHANTYFTARMGILEKLTNV